MKLPAFSPNGQRACSRRPVAVAGERASVLVIVLWITFGLVSLAIYFAQSSNFEFRAADNRVAAIEADQAIESAARYISNVLAAVLLQTNYPPALPDPFAYQQAGVQVGEAMFWLIGRHTNELQTGQVMPYFGLVDESSKLNLNTATLEMLEWLPRMTPDLAANIVSWRQSSNSTATASTNSSSSPNSSSRDASSYGVTADAYLRLIPAYQCKSSPYETVDELRLVFGLTPDYLYGEDANLNGVLDPNENDGEMTPPSDDANGNLDPGLFDYVTVWTSEPNTASDGSERIDVTSTAGQQELATLLQEKFGDSRANEILQGIGIRPGPPRAGTTREPVAAIREVVALRAGGGQVAGAVLAAAVAVAVAAAVAVVVVVAVPWW